MSCTNCYNGCSEITSDQCVKYTGIDVPALGISNGDTLATVEQAVVDFLSTAIVGTGIKPIISPSVLCDLVKSYLPPCTTCTGFDLNQILTAIIQSACSLQTQVNSINSTLATLNADYTLPANCLSGVTASSDTHAILQAVINTLCSVNSAVTNIVTNILPLYVLKSELNGLIQVYLDNNLNQTASSKMIPYVAVPYYGPLSNYPNAGDSFDITGAGQNYWNKVYLCNGNNSGVPDLRGRTVVGATSMGTNTFPAQTNPNLVGSGNPTYNVGDTPGSNQVALTSQDQLAPHNHSVVVNDSTGLTGDITYISGIYNDSGTATGVFTKTTGYSSTKGNVGGSIGNTGKFSIDANHTHSGTTSVVGAGLPHPNVQPGFGMNYIIYIP